MKISKKINCEIFFDLIRQCIYTKEHNKPHSSLYMKWNEHFLREHGAYKITATPTISLGFKTTIENFLMRHCMMFSLKGHQNYQRLKL